MAVVPLKIDDDDKKEKKPASAGYADARIRAGNYGEIGDEQPLGPRPPVAGSEGSADNFAELLTAPLTSGAKERAQDNNRLLGTDTDPNKFADARKLAKKIGANVDDIYEDPKAYSDKAHRDDFVRALQMPATAKFFQNPDNYRVAQDSAEELSAVEATIKYGGRAGARGGLRIAAGSQQFLAEESAQQADDTDKSFMEILRQQSPVQAASPISIYNPFDLLLASERYVTSRLLSQKEAAKAAAYRLRRVQELNTLSQSEYEMAQAGHLKAIIEAGKLGPREAIEAAVSDPVATLLMGLEVAGEFAPQLAVAAGATVAGGPIAGAVTLGFGSALTERFSSPAEYFAKQGYDLSKPEDIKKIVSNREVMLQAQQYGFDRGAIIGSLDAISGGVASQIYGGVLRTILINMVAQPVLGGGGEALAQLKTEGKVENWGEVVVEAVAELAMAPAEFAVFGGKELNNVRKARKVKRQVARLKDALELSRKTKLAERAPEIAAEHRAEVFRDNGIDEVTINANTLNRYAQELDDPGFMESLGVTNEEMAEAIQLDGDIKIDADGFAVLTGAETYSEIADHVRFDDSDMTAAEAQEYEDSFFADQMERLEGQIEAIDLESMSDVETIRKEVEAQVKAAGRSENEAQFYGLLLAERYATRGERADMSPLEMWRRDNVRVTAPGQELPGFDMLDVAIDKLRGGIPAEQFLGLRKTPMINELIERGGVDPTGPLAAELAARDITPKTNRRLFVKGGLQSADDLVQSELDILDAVEGTDTGYVSQDVLIEAIESDIGGAPFRSLDEQRQIEEYEGDIAELQLIMDQAGLTPEATNEEIRAAVDAAMQESREFEQVDTKDNLIGHPDRISTRQPTTKFATEDPLTENLTIDLDTMKRDRNTFEFNMSEIVGRYRNVKQADANLPSDELAENFVNHLISNLLHLYDSVPAETRDRSRLWYDGARALTDKWSVKYNVPDRVVAGVLASLSPQKDWFMNVSLGERVLDIMTNQQNHRFDDAMLKAARDSVLAVKKNSKPIPGKIIPAYKKALKEIQGKTLAEVLDPKHKAIWLRIYDETYNDRRHRIVTPEGEFADWARGTVESPIDDMGILTPVGEEKKTGWGSFSEITKAVNVILDPSPENISIEMGAKHKVRNFFNNILSPNSSAQDVTIDTHAVAAALLQPLSGGSREVHHNFGSSPMVGKKPPEWIAAKNYKGNGVEGLYGIYAEAYRLAASQRGVSARQMQSITWEAARGLFTPAYKQDSANIEAIEQVWDNYRNGKITIEEARDAVVQHAGGINPPEWEGRDSGVIGGEFDSSYSEELSKSGLPRFEPGLSPSGTGSRFTGILAGQGLEPSGVFLQPVYHGTPHRFEKFSTSAIGTGEGLQAYGWGLYFASQWEVANFYRETLSAVDASQFGFEWDGVILTPSELKEELWNAFETEVVYDMQEFGKLKQEVVDSGMMVPDDYRPQDLIDRGIDVPLLKDDYMAVVGFQYFISQWANRGRRDERDVEFAKEQGLLFYQGFVEAEKLIDLFDIKISRPGRLFEVEIPEDDQFLDFSNPITQQSDLVIQAVKNIQEKINYDPSEDPLLITPHLSPQTDASKSAGVDVLSGEQWYRSIAKYMKADWAGREVSLALAKEGVAGNRYLDHSQKSYNYVVYDDKLINVVQYEQRERASIEFRAHETVIKLGKDADPSSFLHENGHLFLEQMKSDALEFGTEQLVTDWNTVRDWWGKNTDTIRREATRYASNKNDQDAVAALEKMSDGAIRAYVRSGDLTGGKEYAGKGGTPESALGYLTEAMHEQFARGFEDYLRTGEAPSVQLQSAFNRFRAWLVSIYSSIKRRLGRDVLDVQYSEEVRQVIDRLLASDQDIELVREQYDLKALYDSAEEAGMTPKQFSTYQRQVARAVERSKTHQLKKHLNEVEREKRDWWKAEGDKIAGQIREELAQEPVYKALWSLTQQALADGTPLPDGLTIGRLDRKALIAILQNKESMQRLPKVKGKVVYTTSGKESGIHPDVAAQMFGFTDAMEMLLAMGQAQPFEAVVAERVDAQLKAKHGDLLNDGSAVEEAIESVHIDETAEVLTAELNALRESKDKMKPAFIRQWAIEKLGGRKVGELRPQEFLQAERRHGKEAGKLLRKGDRLGAQRAKFKQLMNFYMAKEAIKARNEIAVGRRYFSRFTAKRRDYKTLAAEYVDQIKQILANYQFGPRLSDKKRASLMEFAEQKAQEDGVVLTIPPEIAAADGTTNYQDLTLDEFRTLKDTIKAIETQGRHAKNVKIEGEKVAIADAKRQILERLDQRKPRKRMLRAARERTALLRDKLVGALAGFDASLSKIEFLAEMIDGEKVGPFKRFFFQPFADAEAARNDMVAQVGKPIMDAIDGLSKNSRKQLGKKVFVEGMDQNFTRSNLIMMALNTGNESNYDKMLRGSRKDITGARPWTEESIDEALDNLTLEEWQLVQTIWDAFEKMYPQVEEVFRQENGRSPERIDARGFERTFDGQTYTFRGGYFPMMYDGKRSIDGTLIESKTALEAMQSQHVQASVFSGMTKERSAGFAIPVDLDITQIPGHLNSTAHYITHYEPIRTVKKLMRQDDLVRELNLKMGKEYIDTFDSWLGAVASNQALDAHQEWWQKIISIMRTHATVAIMGLSYTTMTAQLLGYFQTVDALSMTDGKYNVLKGKKWLAVGMTEYMRNPRKAIETVNALSGEMRHRINNTERDVSYGLRRLERKMSGKTKIGYKETQRYSLMAIAGIQTFMVDYPTWLGAYNKALSEGRSTEDAAKYADAVLRTTQTAGGIKDLSQVQRSSIMLPLTMFYSFFNVLYNIEKQIVGNVETIKDVPQAAARALVVMILPTAIEQMYKDQWPDEDEEDDDLNQDGMIDNKEYAWWMAKKAGIYAGSSVPIFRDVVGIASGYGYSATPMDSLGKGVDQSFRDLSDAIDDGEITNARLRAMITVVGFSAGLPISQLNRVVRTAYKMEEGEEVDWYDWVRGYRKPSATPFKD